MTVETVEIFTTAGDVVTVQAPAQAQTVEVPSTPSHAVVEVQIPGLRGEPGPEGPPGDSPLGVDDDGRPYLDPAGVGVGDESHLEVIDGRYYAVRNDESVSVPILTDFSLLDRPTLEPVLYDKEYGWELQPGSDVMATALGVLPKIGTYTNGYAFYAGLVTLTAGAVAPPAGSNFGWELRPADTPLTLAGLSGDPLTTYAPGAYIALYYADTGSVSGDPAVPPPYAFPAGWTPGNTTGVGPVLPRIGVQDDGTVVYAGLVDVTAYLSSGWPTALGGGWGTAPITDPVDAPLLGTNGNQPGVGARLGFYGIRGGDAPSAFPAGMHFRPYGIGQVAITDENGGGVIGDIAYVVSGYAVNFRDPEAIREFMLAQPTFIGDASSFAVGTEHLLVAGEYFYDPGGAAIYVASAAPGIPPLIVQDFGGTRIWNYQGPTDIDPQQVIAGLTADGLNGDYAWPFLERYDLAAKKWLPRVPTPGVTKHFDAYTPSDGFQYTAPHQVPGVSAIWRSNAGPYDMGAGALAQPAEAPPGVFQTVTLWTVAPDGTGFTGGIPAAEFDSAGGGSPTIFPAGRYWVSVAAVSGDPYPTGCLDAAVIGDGLGARRPVLAEVPAHDEIHPYAAEGGFVGVIGGKLYFGGGDGTFVTGDASFVYEPVAEAFTQLADLPEQWASDYNPYGVVAGKMWVFSYDGDTVWSYDPTGPDEWVAHATTGLDLASEIGDQTAGFEHGGKLYFSYGRSIYVFDPVALTGALVSTEGQDGLTFLVGDRILTADRNENHLWFDIPSSTWSDATEITGGAPSVFDSEFAGTTWRGTPYLLSAVSLVGYAENAGVYGLEYTGYKDSPPVLLEKVAGVVPQLAALQTGLARVAPSMPDVTLAENAPYGLGSSIVGDSSYPMDQEGIYLMTLNFQAQADALSSGPKVIRVSVYNNLTLSAHFSIRLTDVGISVQEVASFLVQQGPVSPRFTVYMTNPDSDTVRVWADAAYVSLR